MIRLKAGQNLQAALDSKEIVVPEAAVYEGAFTFNSGAKLVGGPGVRLHAVTGNAIRVPVGAKEVLITDLEAQVDHSGVVVALGSNGVEQNTLESVPKGIVLRRVRVPTHRGKRAFEVNAYDWWLDQCEARDVWAPSGQDSQALAILNSPGSGEISGYYEAGSECVLIGGDVLKIPQIETLGLYFHDITLARPLTWQTDGVDRKVKNLFEAKRGLAIRLERALLRGAWRDAQDGWAMVLTPHSGGIIADVQIKNVTVQACGGLLQILGREYKGIPTARPLKGVRLEAVQATINAHNYGGRGCVLLASGEPEDVTILNSDIVMDGTAAIIYDAGHVLNLDGSSRAAGPMKSLTITNSVLGPVGKYGMLLQGQQQGKRLPGQGIEVLTLEGNTMTGASAAFQQNFPQNTYQ